MELLTTVLEIAALALAVLAAILFAGAAAGCAVGAAACALSSWALVRHQASERRR